MGSMYGHIKIVASLIIGWLLHSREKLKAILIPG